MQDLLLPDLEVLGQAMNMASKILGPSRDISIVVSQALATLPQGEYLAALVRLAQRVGTDLAVDSCTSHSVKFLGRAIVAYTDALQEKGKLAYEDAFMAISMRVYPSPGTSAYRELIET